MDQKTWLWKKRIPEKTKVSDGKTDISLKGNGEEVLENEKEVALQESIEILNEKLASVITKCDVKDELVTEHMKKTEEALAGKAKAEAEVLHLKEQLNEALRERAAENGRIVHLNAALKDCMEQLNSARDEQEQKVQDAIVTTSKELTAMNKRLTVENSHLNKALIERDILITELSNFKTQAQAEFNALMARLDSTEKENTLLRYEFRMLEKELDIRNEDRKYTRYSLDASHKQYLESVKKIKKLESECQRLRVLVRKRLPGPASLAKMSREVQSGYQMQTQTRKLNSMTGGLIIRDSTMEPFPDNPGKDINFLVERVREVEEENRVLTEVIVSRLGSSNYETCIESKLLSCGSSVSSSLSEREQFKHGDIKNNSESKTLGISDMSLMDDFVEMEKLAIVAVNSSIVSGPLNSSSATSDITSKCRELVLAGENDFNGNDREHQTRDLSTQSGYDWLQHVLNVLLEQNKVSGRSLNELLEDIGKALYKTNQPKHEKVPISGFITWKSPVESPRASSIEGSIEDGTSVKKATNEEALRAELQTLRESRRMIEDQIENLKSTNEDLDTQLTVAKAKINEAFQKLSSVEVELEHKTHCCEELEGTCLELQLQLESISYEDTQKDNGDQANKVDHTGWEITAASAKLDECQDTILKLGKQLEAAMASSKETIALDKVLSTSCVTTTDKKLNRRLSLLDRMQSEDSTEEVEDKKPPTTKESGLKHEVDTASVGALAIVLSKKRSHGVSFLKKLLMRKKNGSKRKPSFYLNN